MVTDGWGRVPLCPSAAAIMVSLLCIMVQGPNIIGSAVGIWWSLMDETEGG